MGLVCVMCVQTVYALLLLVLALMLVLVLVLVLGLVLVLVLVLGLVLVLVLVLLMVLLLLLLLLVVLLFCQHVRPCREAAVGSLLPLCLRSCRPYLLRPLLGGGLDGVCV